MTHRIYDAALEEMIHQTARECLVAACRANANPTAKYCADMAIDLHFRVCDEVRKATSLAVP